MPQTPERKAAYDKAYNARPAEKKRRAMRNAARRALEKEGLVHKGDAEARRYERPLQPPRGQSED